MLSKESYLSRYRGSSGSFPHRKIPDKSDTSGGGGRNLFVAGATSRTVLFLFPPAFYCAARQCVIVAALCGWARSLACVRERAGHEERVVPARRASVGLRFMHYFLGECVTRRGIPFIFALNGRDRERRPEQSTSRTSAIGSVHPRLSLLLDHRFFCD